MVENVQNSGAKKLGNDRAEMVRKITTSSPIFLAKPKIYEVNFALKRDTQTLEKISLSLLEKNPFCFPFIFGLLLRFPFVPMKRQRATRIPALAQNCANFDQTKNDSINNNRSLAPQKGQ